MVEKLKFLDQALEEAVRPFTDVLLKEAIEQGALYPPPGSVVGEKEWQAKAERELLDFLTLKNLRERFVRSFETLRESLHHLSSSQQEQIGKEWQNAPHRFEEVLQATAATAPGQGSTFAKMLGISENTLELFYQCGLQLLNHEEYQKAA